MPTLDELSKKVDRIESEQRSGIRWFFQFVFSPLLVVVISGLLGYFLTLKVEQAKQTFQRLELEVKRVETAQHMLTELFSDIPERAFIADRLMAKLLDEDLSKEVSSIISQYYSQKLDRKLSTKTLDTAQEIATAAKAIGGRAAESIKTQLQEQRYYVIVASINPGNEIDAIHKATALRTKGYDSEVYLSTSGYLGVTLGYLPLAEAKSLRTKALGGGDAPPDSYLIPGHTFTEKLYPK